MNILSRKWKHSSMMIEYLQPVDTVEKLKNCIANTDIAVAIHAPNKWAQMKLSNKWGQMKLSA